MLNEEKIRIMTRAAIYEQGKGEEDIKITSYSRSDYIRYNMLKTLIGVTVGVILIFGLCILYNMDYFITNFMRLNFTTMLRLVIVIYIVFMAVYASISFFVYVRRYIRAKKRIRIYNEELEIIGEIAEDDEADHREDAGRTKG